MMLALVAGLSASLASIASDPASLATPGHRPRVQDERPEGLSAADWGSLRGVYEAGRHAMLAAEGGHLARSPGQGWTTSFDGRGFTTRPDAGDWTWGLELVRYGFEGRERVVSGTACASAEGQRLAYEWDTSLSEWFVNDARGLEHGYTLRERPGGEGTLSFTLALRGELVPSVQADGRGVSFSTTEGGSALTYAGLAVLDADGRALPAGIELALDGLRLLVDDRDARYPLTIDPIVQQAYLKASNTDSGDRFGCSVAISGDTVVVGADRERSNATGVNGDETSNSAGFAGAVYIFVRSGATWSQQAYLKASNTDVGDYFGAAVAISGDTVVVGAHLEDSNATGIDGDQDDESAFNAGAAYVFFRSGTTWSQQAYLKASNAEADDWFGESVAISGDTVVVGAHHEDSSATGVNGVQGDNGATDAGAAYVFARTGTSWNQQAYLKASNTDAGDDFGISVAISGDTVVIGAKNERSNATGVNGDETSNGARFAGAVYVFVRSGATWSQQAYLKASNTDVRDFFGVAVAISGDTAVVGANFEDSSATGVNGDQANNGATEAGAAYVFVRSGTTWSQQAYLKASNTDGFDSFGLSLAISGDTVVVGAHHEDSSATGVNGVQGDNGATDAGAAYVFARSGTTWSQQAYLKASNTDAGDIFGLSLAISGGTVVVGAMQESSSATGVNGDQADNSAGVAGAVYVFSGLCPPASASSRTAGTNPASYSCTAPVLGALWQGTVDLSTTGHASAYLLVYATPAAATLAGGQVLLGTGLLAVQGPVSGPLASFSFAMPSDTALCGLTLVTQAVHFGAVRPFALSNAMDLVVGQ